jgi:hypothetical protein
MRIEAAFEKAGVLFITDDEIAGIGVRLAKKKEGTMSSVLFSPYRAGRVDSGPALNWSSRTVGAPGRG